MKLILNSDVKSLGRKGDVVEVAKGYARNYLLPKKLAIVATANNLEFAQKLQEKRQQQAQVNNELTIVDYKSAFRKKGNYLIDEYFQQIAAYAEAHDKMHGTNINQFMIVMVYKDNFDCEILIANNSESIKYRKMWQDKLNYYKEVSVE